MIRLALGLTLTLLLVGGEASAADAPAGKAIFDHNCAPCHAKGPGHAGTQRLAQIRGPANAALEDRTDLSADYVRLVVRHGLVEMPAWRLTEINDAELNQLAQYLARAK